MMTKAWKTSLVTLLFLAGVVCFLCLREHEEPVAGTMPPDLVPLVPAIPVAEVRMARAVDLHVGIALAERGSAQKNANGSDEAVLAYLLNKAEEPVQVFVPGFVGPSWGAKKGENRTAALLEQRVAPQFGAGDFVVLRPGDLIGRRQMQRVSGADAQVTVHYTVYEAGREGQSDAIVEVLYPDDKISRPIK